MKQSFSRVLRVAPSFAMLAIGGCVIGMILRVPWEQLGTAVSVPLVVMFIITRLLSVTIMRQPHEKPEEALPDGFVVACAGLAVGILGAMDFLCTAGIYQMLGLSNLVMGALAISGTAFVIAVVSFLLTGCIALQMSFGAIVAMVAVGVISVIWEMLKLPTAIADRMSPHAG